jgi:hypothetical protein
MEETETERWRDGEMESWRDGEMGRQNFEKVGMWKCGNRNLEFGASIILIA